MVILKISAQCRCHHPMFISRMKRKIKAQTVGIYGDIREISGGVQESMVESMVGCKKGITIHHGINPRMSPGMSIPQDRSATTTGWWFQPTYPSEKLSESLGMMTFPTYGKTKNCSKAPIRYIINFDHGTNLKEE